jgi:hypothetical protein
MTDTIPPSTSHQRPSSAPSRKTAAIIRPPDMRAQPETKNTKTNSVIPGSRNAMAAALMPTTPFQHEVAPSPTATPSRCDDRRHAGTQIPGNAVNEIGIHCGHDRRRNRPLFRCRPECPRYLGTRCARPRRGIIMVQASCEHDPRHRQQHPAAHVTCAGVVSMASPRSPASCLYLHALPRGNETQSAQRFPGW